MVRGKLQRARWVEEMWEQSSEVRRQFRILAPFQDGPACSCARLRGLDQQVGWLPLCQVFCARVNPRSRPPARLLLVVVMLALLRMRCAESCFAV